MEKPALERGTAEVQRPARVVGLDALSLRMFAPAGQYVLNITPAPSLADLRALLSRYLMETDAKNVVWTHHILHKRTLDIMRTEFPELPPEPSRGGYKYAPGDVLLVAVLKRRPTRRNPCVPATPEDLAYWLVTVRRKVPIPTPADAIPKL
ncbi:MAG: hypothetical protein ACO2PN_16105 [Pyrobaculum sp.]